MIDYRRRYVRFRVHASDTLDEKELAKAIRKSILMLYGEVTLADSRFYINEFDSATGIGIFHSTLRTLDKILASAALVYKVGRTIVSIQPLKTSGTIKGSKK